MRKAVQLADEKISMPLPERCWSRPLLLNRFRKPAAVSHPCCLRTSCRHFVLRPKAWILLCAQLSAYHRWTQMVCDSLAAAQHTTAEEVRALTSYFPHYCDERLPWIIASLEYRKLRL